MRIRILLIVLLQLLILKSFGQEEFISNGDFETYSRCPDSYTQWNGSLRNFALGWTYPTKGTPDLFHTCSEGTVGIPYNFAGVAPVADSGVAYAGLFIKGTLPEYREYMQVQLKKPLRGGVEYCVKFKWRLSTNSMYATDRIGVFFDRYRIWDYNKDYINETPSVENPKGAFMTNKTGWEEFCGLYTAKGGEEYMILGNFHPDDSTSIIKADIKGIKQWKITETAYYYIDDVSVIPLTDCYVCVCSDRNRVGAKLEPLHVRKFDGSDGAVQINVTGGTGPYRYLWSNGYEGMDVHGLPAGKYNVQIYDANDCYTEYEIEVEQPDTIFSTVDLGVPKILKNVLFYFDKTEFLPSSYKELNDLLHYMEDNPTIDVKLQGHTDSYGSDEYNEELAHNRAMAVMNYLIDHKIDPSRLSFEGFGERVPIATNDTDEGRQLNRRVEFMVIKL